MTLRLNEQETDELRRIAAAEQRSMQVVAKEAIHLYATNREARMRQMFAEIAVRDADLLSRLAK